MTDVTLRATKGSPLTHTEMDNNQVATRSGRKNMIIGGNFDTNPWQRGTAFTAVANGQYTADRFMMGLIGTAVVDHDKIADAPSVAQAGFVVSNCLSVDITTADAAIAATDKYSVIYMMEGYDWAQVAQNDFVISFWHKHTKTGTYCVAVSSQPTPDRSYVAEYTQSVSDTWEKATIKVTASPSAGTWNYTNGVGCNIKFSMGNGTNFHTTADAWNTGNFDSTSSQVNAMDSASNFCRFALIQLEDGIVATDFERRAVGEELALCQRYYESVTGTSVAIWNGYATSGQTYYNAQFFATTKRANPTVVLTNISTTGFSTTPGSASVSPHYIREQRAATSTQARGFFGSRWTADSEL